MSRPILICTVYNRGTAILDKTFEAFSRQTNKDWDMLVVDDGSTDEALEDSLRRCADFSYKVLRVDTQKDRPGCMTTPRGDNNPSYAFNRGIQHALEDERDYLIFFSSDIMPAPNVMRFMEDYYPRLQDVVVHGKAMEPGNQGYAKDGTFCSSTLVRPLGWFFATHSRILSRVQFETPEGDPCWFDEAFLEGFAYEDGDFTGRVALACGKMVIDDSLMVIHQHHSTDQPSQGHRNNARWAMRRWGHPEPWDSGRIRRRDLIIMAGYREFLVSR